MQSLVLCNGLASVWRPMIQTFLVSPHGQDFDPLSEVWRNANKHLVFIVVQNSCPSTSLCVHHHNNRWYKLLIVRVRNEPLWPGFQPIPEVCTLFILTQQARLNLFLLSVSFSASWLWNQITTDDLKLLIVRVRNEPLWPGFQSIPEVIIFPLAFGFATFCVSHFYHILPHLFHDLLKSHATAYFSSCICSISVAAEALSLSLAYRLNYKCFLQLKTLRHPCNPCCRFPLAGSS